jgi:peptidoglycan/LPS O-acetylase OafA/YrhL
MRPTDLKPLTSLRFFAAAWVVLYDLWPKLAGSPVSPLIAKGYLGVELFFVLSGFILCHVYLEAAGEGRFNYAGFLWARLSRIYPMHLATLAGLGLMGLSAEAAGFQVDPSVLAWTSLPANLTLTQAWGMAPQSGWNHPSWSISAEWFAYLAFPLFAALAWKLRHRPYVAAVGALALLIGLYEEFPRFAGFPLDQATIAWGALRIVPSFAYGCAIYLVWRSGAVNARILAISGALFSGACILGAAQLAAPDTLIVGLFGPLILCLAALVATGSRLGSNPLLVYMGEISFSMYMIVVPWSLLFVNVAARILHAQDKQLPLYAWLVLVLGVFPLAAIAHHLIERPARYQMRRWAQALPQRTQSSLLKSSA